MGSAVLGMVALLPTLASAQTICVAESASVPGLSGPPKWDAADASAAYTRVDLHDPRWARAKPVDLGIGGTSTYRILYDKANNQLVVSIQAHDDKDTLGATTAAPNDQIYFGIGVNSAPTSGRLVRIRFPAPAAGTANEPSAVGTSDYATWQNADGAIASWVEDFGSNKPGWMLYPVVWKNNTTDHGNSDWGVNFKVDLTHADIGLAAPTAGAQLRITLGSRVYDEDIAAAVDLALPTGLDPITNTFIQKDMSTWLFTDPLGNACTGIALDRLQIGVGSALTSVLDTDAGDTNELVAKPTGVGFPGQISGRFRIAEWGTIADPAAGWNAVGNNATPPVLDIVSTGSGATAEIRLVCPTNTATETCGIPTPPQAHQCMLVEMKATVGNTVDFANTSVYRNMSFASLSKLQRTATVDVAGLPARTDTPANQDVYLTELRLNMPKAGTEPLSLPRREMAVARKKVEAPALQEKVALCRDPNQACIGNLCSSPCKAGKCGELATPKKLPGGCYCAPQKPMQKCSVPSPDAVPATLTGEQEIESIWPTWKVFAYWDTGKRETINGTAVKKLQPMYPFGLYLDHEGKHFGFKSALAGMKDVVVSRLNDVQYKLSVKNGQKAKLGVTLSAEEQPAKPPVKDPETPKPPSKTCLCAVPGLDSDGTTAPLTGLLGLLGLGWVVRRRRASSRRTRRP